LGTSSMCLTRCASRKFMVLGAMVCSVCRAAFCAAILLLRAKVDSPKCYRYQCYLGHLLKEVNRTYLSGKNS